MKLTKKQIQNRIKWADELQLSKKLKSFLSLSGTDKKCCLGVALVNVCNLSTNFTNEIGMPHEVNYGNGKKIMNKMFGMGDDEMQYLSAINDGNGFDQRSGDPIPELSHKEIGMYLYLTAYAGDDFQFDEDYDLLTN